MSAVENTSVFSILVETTSPAGESRVTVVERLRPRLKNPRALKTLNDDGVRLLDVALRAVAEAKLTLPSEKVGVIVGLRKLSWAETDLAIARQEGNDRLQPLWILKHLPNIPAAQIAIETGARGSSQTLISQDPAREAETLAHRWLQRCEVDTILIALIHENAQGVFASARILTK